MTGFDITGDQQPVRRSGADSDALLFAAFGQPTARQLDGDDQPDKPQRKGPLRRLREARERGEHPLLDRLKHIKEALPQLKPLLEFITGIVDLKKEGSLLKDGKVSLTIDRKDASSVPLDKMEDPSKGLFKPLSLELGKKISFDFSLKDGLTNVKGIGIKGKSPLGEKTIAFAGATLTTKDGEPCLQVKIAPDPDHPERTIPFTIPLKKLTDK